MKKIAIVSILAILSFQSVALSETITLKSGKTVDGKILEKTDEYIKVELYGVPITYYLDEIVSIKSNDGNADDEIKEIPRKQGLLREEALKKWEQHHGITVDEYWKGQYEFQQDQKEYKRKMGELVKKHFGKEFQSFEELRKKSVEIPPVFMREFQSIKRPPYEPLEPFNVLPPPAEPPEWFKETLTTRSKESQIALAGAVITANLPNAIKLYELNTGHYPGNLQELLENSKNVDNWYGPYIEKRSLIDPWENPYKYRYPGIHAQNEYDLLSYGPDGIESEDDINNWDFK